MTNIQFNRYSELCSKMEKAKIAANRTYTDTADLNLGELYEYRRLRNMAEAMQGKHHEEQIARMNRSQLSSFMPYDPPCFDGDW